MKAIIFFMILSLQVGCLPTGGSTANSDTATTAFATDWAGSYELVSGGCEVRSGAWVCDSTVPPASCATAPNFTDTHFTIAADGSSVQFIYKSVGISDGTETTGPTGNYQIQISFPDYNWSMTLVTLSRFPGMADPFAATPPADQDSIVAVFAPGCAVEYTRTVSQ